MGLNAEKLAREIRDSIEEETGNKLDNSSMKVWKAIAKGIIKHIKDEISEPVIESPFEFRFKDDKK